MKKVVIVWSDNKTTTLDGVSEDGGLMRHLYAPEPFDSPVLVRDDDGREVLINLAQARYIEVTNE